MRLDAFSPCSILLVEDDAVIALGEKADLEAAGYRVMHVLSGEAAVKAMRSGDASIDLVLMDIDLGKGMDGIETARAILALRELPVVFLSAHTERSLVERTEEVTSYGYVVKNSGAIVLEASIKMAMKLFLAHRTALEKERELDAVRGRLEAVIEGSGAGTWDWNMESGELTVNERYIAMLGYTRAEMEPITHSTFTGLEHPEDLRRSNRITEQYDAGEIAAHEIVIRMRHKDGHWVWIMDRGKVTRRDDKGRPLRMSGMHFDISDLKEAEAELEENRNQLSLAIEGSGIGLWDRDFRTGHSTYNEQWARMLGYAPEELGTMTADAWECLAHPGDRASAEARRVDYLEGRIPAYECEVRMRHRDGRWIWVLTRGKVVEREADGRPRRMIGTHLDITARKATEEAQARLVEQKETLMRELQHRVKNSLAVVSSLLGLEMAKVPEGGPREALAEAAGRIKSVALVYERLYLSDDLVSVDLSIYIDEVARSILDLYGKGRRGMILDLRLEDARSDSRRAVPLGLILSELLLNALKHAYPAGEGGRIGIALLKQEPGIRLSVEDDGVGFPGDLDPVLSGTMGLSLVSMLATQAGGKVSFGRSGKGGARIDVLIPAPT